MIRSRTMPALLAASLSIMGACQSSGLGTPAVLLSADAETMAEVKTVLARAMGVAAVELGAGDPTASPTLSVLPPRATPYDDRSLAQPALFDIVLMDGRCHAVRRDTGEAYALDGVACRAVSG